MSYNEEIAQELKNMGFKGRLYKLKPEEKGTQKDWILLEKQILKETKENEIMLERSIQYAKNSAI